MFGLFIYAVLCFAVALALISVWSVMRRVSTSGDRPMAPRLLVAWILLLALPYVGVEIQTALYGDQFADQVNEALESGLIEGDTLYYRVQNGLGSQAQLVLVAHVGEDWGGTYRNIYRIRMVREGAQWSLVGVEPVDVSEGPSGGFTIPPYW
ncbi:MAG: hypothetical protein IH851_02420 [Armatimonadetes bacterium]|nr:hypothetical protein [Armatimonadota bacterium]